MWKHIGACLGRMGREYLLVVLYRTIILINGYINMYND